MNLGIEKILNYKETFNKNYFSEDMFKEDLTYAYEEIGKFKNISLSKKAEESLLNLLSANNVCPETTYKKLALQKIEKLNEKEKDILSKSLYWVNEQRQILDNQQYQFLVQFNKETDEKWLQWISYKLLMSW